MSTTRQPELSDATLERAMVLSKLDALAFALMVGLGEAYFLADGVRLGASPMQIALLVGLPLAIGALGPILSLRLMWRFGRRKPVVLGAASVQASLLFLLAWLSTSGRATTQLLTLVTIAYQVCGQCSGTAWSSWYGDLVPGASRGRYFASRNRVAYAGTLVGLVLGGLLLSQFEQSRAGVAGAIGGTGFGLAYLAAGVCRVASTALLAVSAEGRFLGVPNRAHVGRFLRTERGSNAWRLILLVGLLQVTVFVSSPYFNPFMLEELEFTYIEYMLASAVVVAVKTLVLPLWGRSIDTNGVRRTLVVGGVLVALIPLPWVFANGLVVVLFCQTLSGAAWAGFEVGHFSMLLELGYRRMRPTVFAAQSLVSGSAQLLGGLLGSLLLTTQLGARGVFALSSGLRVVVVVLLVRFLVRRTDEVRRKRLPVRLGSFRPGTGVSQRPIEESQVAAAPPPDLVAAGKE
ncbi:MAG: MFS transporter [Planctomycetota bacterium]|nr:MFS transporter [Planctomycetota bacterium]